MTKREMISTINRLGVPELAAAVEQGVVKAETAVAICRMLPRESQQRVLEKISQGACAETAFSEEFFALGLERLDTAAEDQPRSPFEAWCKEHGFENVRMPIAR